MKRLGVNIDHVATIRNARGESHPDPVNAAKFANNAGADSITIHLREDRRHIKDLDAKKICSLNGLLVNLEISTNNEIVKNETEILLINSFGSLNDYYNYCKNVFVVTIPVVSDPL